MSFDCFKVCFSCIFGQFPCLGSSRNRIPDPKEGVKGISEIWRPSIKHFGTLVLWTLRPVWWLPWLLFHILSLLQAGFFQASLRFYSHHMLLFLRQMVLQISGKEVLLTTIETNLTETSCLERPSHHPIYSNILWHQFILGCQDLSINRGEEQNLD